MTYHVLYRGPLSSCNYDCGYCPFAKRHESRAELTEDRAALERFLMWIERQQHCRFGVLFTPWGEATVRPWYRAALAHLSHLPHVYRVAIQTNLSCGLAWLSHCRRDRLGFWASYHPAQVRRENFLARVRQLYEMGIRVSVGVVGLREHLDEIRSLRAELPPDVYLWVNAYKRQDAYYQEGDVDLLSRLDPLFPLNNQRHPSQGEWCGAGETSFTVDGAGVMRRCHFVAEPIGSIHEADWERALRQRRCPNATCSYHIGYVYLKRLELDRLFGDGILERIPASRTF